MISNRVNFVSRGLKPSPEVLRSTLQKYADLARPFGWVVQMYSPLEDIDALADLLDGDALGCVFQVMRIIVVALTISGARHLQCSTRSRSLRTTFNPSLITTWSSNPPSNPLQSFFSSLHQDLGCLSTPPTGHLPVNIASQRSLQGFRKRE